jgi:multidrug resistance efflux pump
MESNAEESEDKAVDPPKTSIPGPVKKTIVVCLAIGLLFMTWYVLSDRITPYTSQAIVNGFVIPIVPEVSGTVLEIEVDQNRLVEAGDVLLQIDPERYRIKVQEAEIELEKAGQAIGTDTASVATAQAALLEARARLVRAERDLQRVTPLHRDKLVSQAEFDMIGTRLKQEQAGFEKAEAELDKAKSALGNQGSENTKVRSALNALAQAKVDLRDTTIRAPSNGGVTNLQIGAGHYAGKGAPLMTFISSDEVWVEARLRENNLGRLKAGDRVDIVLDIAPGRIFKGEVMSVGYGVANNLSKNLGGLPDIRKSSGWLRDPQRFPVLIRFSDDKALGLRRVGGQASVMVYTGSNPLLNGIGKLRIWLASLASYLY